MPVRRAADVKLLLDSITRVATALSQAEEMNAAYAKRQPRPIYAPMLIEAYLMCVRGFGWSIPRALCATYYYFTWRVCKSGTADQLPFCHMLYQTFAEIMILESRYFTMDLEVVIFSRYAMQPVTPAEDPSRIFTIRDWLQGLNLNGDMLNVRKTDTLATMNETRDIVIDLASGDVSPSEHHIKARRFNNVQAIIAVLGIYYFLFLDNRNNNYLYHLYRQQAEDVFVD
jgi:hypothetical protein